MRSPNGDTLGTAFSTAFAARGIFARLIYLAIVALLMLILPVASVARAVRELGFANLSIGLVGLGAALSPSWVTPGALAGGVFYALAGLNHIRQPHRGRPENFARIITS